MPIQNEPASFSREATTTFRSAAHYLLTYAFILVVYGGAVITDYLLFWLIALLLREDVAKYPFVATWFDRARIGLACLLILFAVVHGILSTISQVRMDWDVANERPPFLGQ
jgi:hypothetical protein